RPGSAGAASNRWGVGGHVGAPQQARETEERPGSAGAASNRWGFGGHVGAPAAGDARQRSALALPGRDEQVGVWGPCRGPHLKQERGAGTDGPAPRLVAPSPMTVPLGGASAGRCEGGGPPAHYTRRFVSM